jgi:hypothetical protein
MNLVPAIWEGIKAGAKAFGSALLTSGEYFSDHTWTMTGYYPPDIDMAQVILINDTMIIPVFLNRSGSAISLCDLDWRISLANVTGKLGSGASDDADLGVGVRYYELPRAIWFFWALIMTNSALPFNQWPIPRVAANLYNTLNFDQVTPEDELRHCVYRHEVVPGAGDMGVIGPGNDVTNEFHLRGGDRCLKLEGGEVLSATLGMGSNFDNPETSMRNTHWGSGVNNQSRPLKVCAFTGVMDYVYALTPTAPPSLTYSEAGTPYKTNKMVTYGKVGFTMKTEVSVV